jgi:sugar/nucleoside kinase (ribokinase family)
VDMISFGTVFLELVFGQLDRLPGPGEEVFTDEFAISCGGAVTSATAAAAAGVRAGLCTRLGDDLGSQVVTEHCASAGVDLSPSSRVSWPTAGITVVLNFDGDRGFVTHLPAVSARGDDSPELPVSSERAEIERWCGVLRDYRPAWCYLHPGRWVPLFLHQARELGCKIVLDVSLGVERERETVLQCVRLADIFVPNADELVALTGAASLDGAIAAAASWGTELVVTRGAAGAVVVGRDGTVTEISRGIAQVRVRDLTGAGDSFAGAMIAALLGGASIADAAVAGNAAGSKAVGRLGGVGAVGGGSGAGWPLRPMVVNDITSAFAGTRRAGGGIAR